MRFQSISPRVLSSASLAFFLSSSIFAQPGSTIKSDASSLSSSSRSTSHYSTASSSPVSHPVATFASKSSLDCKNVQVYDQTFDLSALGGRHSVHWIQVDPPGRPGTHNLTFTVDICQPLEPVKDLQPQYQCPNGTRVCAVDHTYYESGQSVITHVVPIAGDFDNRSDTLQPRWSFLKKPKDAAFKDGVRLDLGGGEDKAGGDRGVMQMAVIDFGCDEEIEGDDVDEPGHSEAIYKDSGLSSDNGLDRGRSLQFVSYKEEVEEPVIKVLRLEWKTKHVCPTRKGESGKTSSSWGFFTWLIIIVFLGIAATLIFGAFTRSGIQSWEHMPQSEMLSEIPYMLRDFARRIIGAFQTRNSSYSGGYTAV